MGFFARTERWVVKWLAPLVAGWRASAIVTILAIMVAFYLLLADPNLGDIAHLLLVVPIASASLIGLLICRRGRAKLICVALLCSYALISWQMQEHWMEIRADLRWTAYSQSLKDVALRQDSMPGSGIKWIIWDGWGMFAQDTDVYLVYSPDDQLRNYSQTRLSGLPCPVWRVQRLEKDWYSVTFYTEEGWDYCGASAR